MKKKMIFLFLIFMFGMLLFMPNVLAGGGNYYYDIAIRPSGNEAESIYTARTIGRTADEITKYYIANWYGDWMKEENEEWYFATEDFAEYVKKINDYLPEGISVKLNDSKKIDIYMDNVNYDGELDFIYDIGNLYVQGDNSVDTFEFLSCYDGVDTNSIIGKNNASLLIKQGGFTIDKNLILKDINIQIDGEHGLWFDDNYFGSAYNTFNVENPTLYLILDNSSLKIRNSNYGVRFSQKTDLILKGNSKVDIQSNIAAVSINELDYEQNWTNENEITFVKNLLINMPEYEIGKADGLYTPQKTNSSGEKEILKKYVVSSKKEEITLKEQSKEKIEKGEKITFRFDSDIETFKELYINDNKLEKDKDYTIESGSTIITLSSDYTNSLSDGTYNVKAVFTTGEGLASFEVGEGATKKGSTEANPKTWVQNNTYMYVFAIIGLIGFIFGAKRVYKKSY